MNMSLSNEVISNMNIKDIMHYHNCKHPCLMIDFCEEVIPGKYAKVIKNFTYDEWYFAGHFEDDPNVPSSIQLEAMSQALLMAILTVPGYAKANTACLKINNVVFKRKIIPGESLILTAQVKSFRKGIAQGHIEGYVRQELSCSADYTMGVLHELEK